MSASDDDKPPKPGVRKDGKPYKDGNTRADGSYAVGKNRPAERTKFAVGDGRKRGRRTKGTKNLLTEWREELDSKLTLTEGGKTKKITKRRALIKSSIERAIKRSDRAVEMALRYAELSERREPGLQSDDLAMIDAWLAARNRGSSDDGGSGDGGSNDGGSADVEG